MPYWITVYCRKSVSDVTPAQLLKGIAHSDFDTLAEDFDIPEELVEPAVDLLRVEAVAEGEHRGLRVFYRPPGEREVEVHFWTEPPRVREEIDEVLERLDGDDSGVARRVRAHLPDVKAVVGIELGFGQLEEMGIVIAYDVARWFADEADGIVTNDDEEWYALGPGGSLRDL